MKIKLLLLNVLITAFSLQSQAQDRSRVQAMNAEISDNLDLKAVASIFGDSRNLKDFEKRLNDPQLQISNLDLNNDNEVDYLRVIETVDKRTHVIVIQAILDRDIYQDVATIDVEKDKYNKIHIQVVGDVYMYGQNYIYEPVYYTTPVIYTSFWSVNYNPYCSTWNWNYYPTYYNTWNPYPVFRYRKNISICLNSYNDYNYVSYRRSRQAVIMYSERRCNGYERQYPNYAFSRRNSEVNNRYELDQRRVSRSIESRDQVGNSRYRGTAAQENTSQRAYFQGNNTSRENASQGATPQRLYSQGNTSRENASQRATSERGYSRGNNTSRENTSQRATPQREYSQNSNNGREQRTEQQRSESNARSATSRDNNFSSGMSNRRS